MHFVNKLIVSIAFLVGAVTPVASKACNCSSPTTDSLPQLAQYAFIAHVRITGLKDTPGEKGRWPLTGDIYIEVLELFKGGKYIK